MISFRTARTAAALAGLGFCVGAAALPTLAVAQAAFPPTSVEAAATWRPLGLGSGGASTEPLADFRLRVRVTSESGAAVVMLGTEPVEVPGLTPGRPHRLEISCAGTDDARVARVSVSVDGEAVGEDIEVMLPPPPGRYTSAETEAADLFRLDRDFTVSVRFAADGDGTLVARCLPDGEGWVPDAKALFIRGGRLVYDIGWVGALRAGPGVADGEPHTATLVSEAGGATLYLDGEQMARNAAFTAPDPEGHVMKTGRAATDFGGEFEGRVDGFKFYRRALAADEVVALAREPGTANTPDFEWRNEEPRGDGDEGGAGAPGPAHAVTVTFVGTGGTTFSNPEVQDLGTTPHAELVAAWGEVSLERGRAAYTQWCLACHGTPDKPGTLPTARAFHRGPFMNGNDPFRVFQTLDRGYGQMTPQPHLSDREKYDIIHYVREEFLKPHNPADYTEITGGYLDELPLAHPDAADAGEPADDLPPYRRMDFGPSLFGTYQVADGNIARKGLAIRLDPGPGGVSRGRAWMVYDHDTMRVAAAYTGSGGGDPSAENFIDWRSIAFDGSHGTHPSIVGDIAFTNPDAPGAADPATGSWDDPRAAGRDGARYGPLPGSWMQYRGLYHYGDKVVLDYSVSGARVLELPGLVWHGEHPVFTRSFDIGGSWVPLAIRLAPAEGTEAMVLGPDGVTVTQEEGFHVLHIPVGTGPCTFTAFVTRADRATLEAHAQVVYGDLDRFTEGGPARFETPEPIVTTTEVIHEAAPWAVDSFPPPDDNPWGSWMRFGGFDFDPADSDRALVGTWSGDIWSVTGIAAAAPAELTWRRVATGLFQPLGLKFRDGVAYVTCRDQIAELHDLNGDGEIDHMRAFNSDHQVTEHFHEFAMGLQTDDEGNFYYAKSARHALPAVVPHHGTLLKVAADGSGTEILASGFRAANGVCLNPDGTFMVTDQEGHWTPKNRINLVRPGRFYGNMMAYDVPDDPSDDAMEPPLCWLTNSFDRSPAELLWVPEDAAWGALNGTLISLSYGYGMVFAVPHEQVARPGRVEDIAWQGGACPLPLPRLPTGLVRGRFSPADGQLYACGMFAWAGNQTEPGGLYRVRQTGGAALGLPTGFHAAPGALTLTFTEPLRRESAEDPENYQITTWDLERSKSYGSRHVGERPLRVTAATLGPDGKSVTLGVPDLARCHSLRVQFELNADDGTPIENELHGTVHALGEAP